MIFNQFDFFQNKINEEQMKKDEINRFKKMLLEEKENVLKEIADSDESAKDLLENDIHSVNDSVDEASSKVTQTLLNIMTKNHQEKYLSIDAALRRITEGTFGKCVSCGSAIDQKRLKSVPWATKCIDCKTKDEKKH
jgi:DnaK suppressor protein